MLTGLQEYTHDAAAIDAAAAATGSVRMHSHAHERAVHQALALLAGLLRAGAEDAVETLRHILNHLLAGVDFLLVCSQKCAWTTGLAC